MTRDASAVVDSYIAALQGEARRVAAGEWGLTVDAAGWPLHVGVAIRDGLLRAQGEVVGPGRLPPESLLRWNRGLPFVRFSAERPSYIPESARYVGDVAKTPDQKALVELLSSGDQLGRPFIMSKRVPAERVAIMRAATQARGAAAG